MSMPRGMSIQCPNCKKEGNFTIWHTLNVDVNPEERERVKSGDVFKYTCKNCGNSFQVEYRFMYHDTDNHFQIWYFPKEEYDIEKECAELNNTDVLNFFKGKEKIRIVNNKNDLIEKIMIFEDALDDILIEVLKIIIEGQANNPDLNIYYNGIEGDDIRFWLSDGRGAKIPYKKYKELGEDFIINEPDDCLIINRRTSLIYAKSKEEIVNNNEEENKKFCTNCGKEIKGHWKYCNYCGNKID